MQLSASTHTSLCDMVRASISLNLPTLRQLRRAVLGAITVMTLLLPLMYNPFFIILDPLELIHDDVLVLNRSNT